MCDTFVALQNVTRDGSVIFGKNSDREPNEAQEVVVFPAQDHQPGSKLRCTYIEIPQVRHTYAVLLSKPFWMWGAEMGLNEHGVVIGNEALFSRLAAGKDAGMIGMDLLRLALERSATAREALETITGLLSEYGQSGNCGFSHSFYYHNSFLLADSAEAWVLETVGKEWAAEKVQGFRSISNVISIGSKWDLASPGLVRTAVGHGFTRQAADFHFSRDYSDFLYTTFGAGRYRQTCTMDLLGRQAGGLTLPGAMKILRSHGASAGPSWCPDRAVTGAEVCMHAGFGPVRGSQTTGSLIVQIKDGQATAWVTATAAPCTSIFKPLWIAAGTPWREPAPGGVFSADCLWWRHELLHRWIIKNYPARITALLAERDDLEAGFIERAGGPGDCASVSRDCFQAAEAAEKRWLQALCGSKGEQSVFYYEQAWKDFNRQAGWNDLSSSFLSECANSVP